MSFFDKLKGSAEAVEGEGKKEKPKKRKAKEKTTTPEKSEPLASLDASRSGRPEKSGQEIKPEVEKKPASAPKKEEERFQTGGQLTLDVYETRDDFIIQSTVAGVKPEDVDISIEGDLVSVRGIRQRSTEEKEEGKYLYQECYWGEFSREVILPEEVDASKAEAKIKDGVLTLKIPKARKTKRKKITVTSSE